MADFEKSGSAGSGLRAGLTEALSLPTVTPHSSEARRSRDANTLLSESPDPVRFVRRRQWRLVPSVK